MFLSSEERGWKYGSPLEVKLERFLNEGPWRALETSKYLGTRIKTRSSFWRRTVFRRIRRLWTWKKKFFRIYWNFYIYIFRLIWQDENVWVIFDHFWNAYHFWDSWAGMAVAQRRPTFLWESPQMWQQRCHCRHNCKRTDLIAKILIMFWLQLKQKFINTVSAGTKCNNCFIAWKI